VLQTTLAVTLGIGLALIAGKVLTPMAYAANPIDPLVLA